VGTIRRGTPDETGNPYATFVVDRLPEGRLSQVPPAYPASDPQLSRAGICKYLPSP